MVCNLCEKKVWDVYETINDNTVSKRCFGDCRKKKEPKGGVMKTAALIVILSLIAGTSHAGEYVPHSDEWGIPGDIHTEADLAKYEGYRKGYLVAGLALLAGSLVTATVSGRYSRRASRINIYGPIIGVKDGKGGLTGVQTFIPGTQDRQARYRTKSAGYKKAAIISGVLGLLAISVSYSLRF